mgnify:FL=1
MKVTHYHFEETMTSSDLIAKSIENLILYGIDLQIRDEDANEYLFLMERFYNEKSTELVATLDIDAVVVETLEGESVCNIFIKDGNLRIIPTTNENAFAAIVLMLEFVTSQALLETEEIEKEQEDEESDDDFDWI